MSENDLIDRLNEIREEIRKFGFDLIPINISIAHMEALNPDLEYRGEQSIDGVVTIDKGANKHTETLTIDSKPQIEAEESVMDIPILNSNQMRWNQEKTSYEVKGMLRMMTERAYQIQIVGMKDSDAIWFPKSTVQMKQEQINLPQWMIIKSWILRDKGLIIEGGK